MPIDLSGAEPFEQQARQAEQHAVGMGAQAYKLPDMLRQAVTERFQGSPLYGQREAATEQVMTSGARGREQLAGLAQTGQAITSPTQQQSILAAQRAADVVPLMSINDLLRIQTGGIEGLVGSGTNAFNAMVAQAQGQAQLARQTAGTQWDQLFQQQQFEEQQRQFDLSQALSREQFAQKGGGEGGGFDLSSLFSSLFGLGEEGGFDTQPTEEMPLYSMPEGSMSPGGEWVSDFSAEAGWTPSGQGGGFQSAVGGIQLQDPVSGQIYTYSEGYADPDYQADLANGYVEVY